MLPTFVIGLREGLEASLIVGIVAAFLRRNGRVRDLWKMWTGVGAGVALCTVVAIALRVAERNLPQKQQEGLETVVGLIAVGFGEAATAVNNAAVVVDPSAHVFPGHSSEGS